MCSQQMSSIVMHMCEKQKTKNKKQKKLDENKWETKQISNYILWDYLNIIIFFVDRRNDVWPNNFNIPANWVKICGHLHILVDIWI
jgi:hypothetical protein